MEKRKGLFLLVLIFILFFSSSVLAFNAKELALKSNRLILMNGDVNADGKVDVFDLAAIGIYYGTEEGDANWNWKADIANTVGEIDIFDLAEVGLNYGKNYIQVEEDPVFISPAAKNVIINDVFSVSVDISTNAEVYAADFVLSFNPSILKALNITEGNFLKKDGASTYCVSEINNTSGRIEFACTRIGTQNTVTGEGTLAVLDFKALNIGSSDVDFVSLTLVDANLNEIQNVSKIKGVVNVASQPGENTHPVISGIPDKNIDEDTTPPANWIDLYPYTNDAEDSDDALIFSIESQTNSGLINCYISGDRYLECNKPAANQNSYNDVTVKVMDTGALFDTDTVRITVNPVNDAPVIDNYSPLTDVIIQEKQSKEFSVSTSDVDSELTVKWYLSGNEVGTGNSYNYISDCNSQGIYEVKVKASDGQLTAEHVWTLTVEDVCSRIYLTAGNNIFSLPRNQEKSFNELNTDCEVVYEGERADLAYYIPSGENISSENYVFVALSETLYPGQGYFVKVEEDCYIEMNGDLVEISDLGYLGTGQLLEGWNLLGSVTNPTVFNKGTCSLFGSVGILKYGYNVASCNEVAGYNGGYAYCSVEGGISRCRCAVNSFEPGLGYWIRTANDCSLA